MSHAVSRARLRGIVLLLAGTHVLVIAASNYLVQLPVVIAGVRTTWGAFSFPLIFLATDLSVRVLGQDAARRVVLRAMLPALVVSYGFGVLFEQGAFQGTAALSRFSPFVARIALASFCAYAVGQLLDIHVFERLRRRARWWVAPSVSTVFGNLADTVVFFALAFHRGPDAFMARHWPEIAAVDYGVKLTVSLLVFVPVYGAVLAWLKRWLLGPDGRIVPGQ